MDGAFISVMRDSVETSVNLKLFRNTEEATSAHLFNSKLVKIPMSLFVGKGVENFNSETRLQKSAVKAYPLHDRPRGNEDIRSVTFYQRQIRQQKDNIPSIWMIQNPRNGR